MKLIHRLRETRAQKLYVCEKCGADVIPRDMCYSYKPLPRLVRGKWRADKWRRRCCDCKPIMYEEATIYDKP